MWIIYIKAETDDVGFLFYFMLWFEFRLIISPSSELHCNTDFAILCDFEAQRKKYTLHQKNDDDNNNNNCELNAKMRNL